MTKILREKMNCDIILTFDKMYGGQTQAFLNFDLEVRHSDTDINDFILDKLFKMIDKKISSKYFGFERAWLSHVSSSCNWNVYQRITGNNDLTELHGGKWRFDECTMWRLPTSAVEYWVKQKYGLGTKTDGSWFWTNMEKSDDRANTDYAIYVQENSGNFRAAQELREWRDKYIKN